uniref:5'-3' exoribonuclease n=1 Tax=Lygus hesperus TaxID=30085 RepID=A0A0A9XCK9_LYGHE
MGVPAFFRWLSRKYPSVVIDCIEEGYGDDNAEVDASKPNPNGVEFDNLYLDMNGIIHPCTHPENKPAPKDENEMMVAIFECIDRLFNIVRPRKVLYMAIDGVAPRAKMNQQRSRRFRAAKEAWEKEDQIEKIRNELMAKGINLPPPKEKGSHFDSNCITPGTEFMARLTECLNFYIHDRLMKKPGWKGIKVILSDASVPGEGEHKIMDFIRRQRALPEHDPNTHHCLCGADADLIMLGLATHEPNFTIIREEFLMNQPKKCDICGQQGHELKDCRGLEHVDSDFPSVQLPGSLTKYIFVRLNVLREYLQEELKMPNLPFNYDFERVMDDWVFMCFFVGNDFLPHLPSLEIRENAIDRLIRLYKKTVFRTGGYLTDSGDVNLERVQLIMADLGVVEDEIFKNRQKNEVNFKLRNKQREATDMASARKTYHEMMKEILEEEASDEVKLWEPGFKDRYYRLKFNLEPHDTATRYKIGFEYTIGLCWVLKYYYQGCKSWKWYFPYHYAPFASDMVNMGGNVVEFEKNTQPFSPIEQLMGVFPAASGNFVPPAWRDLMTNPTSPILDFYPKDFMIDLNGKKFAWQGVALLPFVDEVRIRKGLAPVYHTLTAAERKRNEKGHDRLYMNVGADCFDFVRSLDPEVTREQDQVDLVSTGVVGKIFISDKRSFFQGSLLSSPIPGLDQVKENTVVCVNYKDPAFDEDHKFMARRLPGAIDPPRTLGSGNNRGGPILGFGPRTDRARLGQPGHRMMRHELPSGHNFIPLGGGQNSRNGGNWNNYRGNDNKGSQSYGSGGRTYNNQPPPSSYSGRPTMYNQGNNQTTFDNRGNSSGNRGGGGGGGGWKSYQQQQQQSGGYGSAGGLVDRGGRGRGRGGGRGGYSNNDRNQQGYHPYRNQQQQQSHPPNQNWRSGSGSRYTSYR